MGFTPVHEYQSVITLGSSSAVVPLGGYTFAQDLELKWVRLTVLVVGTPGGSETMTLGVYSRNDVKGQLFAATAVTVSDFYESGAAWIGFVRFDFNRQQLQAGIEYWLGITTANYTRNGDTYYIGIGGNWSPAVNSGDDFATGAHFFGYEARTKPT